MKVSTKVEYGIIAIMDIAMYSEDNQSVTSLQISERHGISKKFLEQIMTSLRTAKLVTALKGSKGGYKLTTNAQSISLAEILNALDISILETPLQNSACEDSRIKEVINNHVWEKMNQSILDIANGITLQDLIDEFKKTNSLENLMYYI
jgi:Rrf2 family protein